MHRKLVSPTRMKKRKRAIRVADAINSIGGVPVSEYAKKLSNAWARGDITGQQMKDSLIASHKLMNIQTGAKR